MAIYNHCIPFKANKYYKVLLPPMPYVILLLAPPGTASRFSAQGEGCENHKSLAD